MTIFPSPRRGFIRAMFSAPVCATAIKVALLVGTLLNFINQGEAIMTGVAPDWLRLALNYLVPFLVSAWSGARALRGQVACSGNDRHVSERTLAHDRQDGDDRAPAQGRDALPAAAALLSLVALSIDWWAQLIV